MQKLRIGDFVFDAAARELHRPGQTRRLELKAALILERLARHPSQTVKRADLLDAAWPNNGGSDEALTQAVAQIRRAFAPEAKNYIQTVARTGYRLVADVAPASEQQVMAEPVVAPQRTPSDRRALWISTAALAISIGILAMASFSGGHGLFHRPMIDIRDDGSSSAR